MAERNLVVVDNNTGEITDELPRLNMSPDKVQLLKDTFCQGATDDEFEIALAVIQRMQLDPFARQITFIKRWNSDLKREVMTPQVTIDGARLLAERTRKYGGQLGPWWCGPDGVWHDIWLKDELPSAARVGVIRTDWREPLYAVARFDAYAGHKRDGTLTAMWSKMPDILIAKCAESLALRRAFPAELSGVYTNDEMGQADNQEVTTVQLSPQNPAPAKTPKNQTTPKADPNGDAKATLWAEAQKRGLTLEMLDTYAQETLGAALKDMATSAIVQLHQRLKSVTDNDQLLDRLGNRQDDDDAIDVPTDMFPDVEFGAEDPDRHTR